MLSRITQLIPDEWLTSNDAYDTPGRFRKAYVDYLIARVEQPQGFVEEAIDARARPI
jgi:hypothetical protein